MSGNLSMEQYWPTADNLPKLVTGTVISFVEQAPGMEVLTQRLKEAPQYLKKPFEEIE